MKLIALIQLFTVIVYVLSGTAVGSDPVDALLQVPFNAKVFAKENLMAWCIVPFDAAKRTPEQRASMLRDLGIKRFAYDYRAEHIPSFEREIAA